MHHVLVECKLVLYIEFYKRVTKTLFNGKCASFVFFIMRIKYERSILLYGVNNCNVLYVTKTCMFLIYDFLNLKTFF